MEFICLLSTEGEEVLISFWIYSLCLNSAIWCASFFSALHIVSQGKIIRAVRESMLFSIARIVYGTQYLRRLSLGLSVLFFCMWAAVVGQKAWHYGHSVLTHPGGLVYAFMTRPMVVYELTSAAFSPSLCMASSAHDPRTGDCLSIMILIVLPLRILWSLKLPRRQKRMIIAIFTSSIIVASVSIFRTVCQINKYSTVMVTATDFEVRLTFFVCLAIRLLVSVRTCF